MRQLHPRHDDVDPLDSYLAVDRPAPDGRPWVTVGMISALDGATVVDGRSGGLGGPADQEVLRAVRGIADVVVVGAATVRAEDYGPLRHADDVRAAREAAGRSTSPPRLVIVTGRLSVDPGARVFRDAPVPPLVCTTEQADAAAVAAFDGVAEILTAGADRVDIDVVLARLRSDGAEVAVCEGGPSLNGTLVDAGVVDEWCVTVSPTIGGGDSRRIVSGASAVHTDLDLASLLTADGMLFGRWVRRDP